MDFRHHSSGDKVASWTHFCSCLHASLCGLFSSYCPRLTRWCNSQQAHSFTPLPFSLYSVLSSFSVTSFHVASFLLSLLPPFYTLTICYFFPLLQICIIFSPLRIIAFLQLFSTSIFFIFPSFCSRLLSFLVCYPCVSSFSYHVAPPSLFPVFNVFPSLKKKFF